MAGLQEIVDGLAAATGRAIEVEDRRFRLLAHSAHDGPVDVVRRDTILRRAASPEVVDRLELLDLAQATAPVRLPAAPELDMGPRLVVPVRDGAHLLGYVWVLDEPRLPDEEAARLGAAVAPLTAALVALRDAEDARRRAERDAITRLLEAGDPASAAALLPPGGPVVVAVSEAGADLEALRRRIAAGAILLGEHAAQPVAVVANVDVPEAPGALLGVSAPRATLADAHAAHREAVLALRVARAVPGRGPVARFGALGAHGLLAPLAFPADGGPPTPLPAAIATLRAAPDGPELLATLRTLLDAGEDIAGAAATLHVHRSTLHRRLRRVEQLTGVTLSDGQARLVLHAGLLLAELRPPDP